MEMRHRARKSFSLTGGSPCMVRSVQSKAAVPASQGPSGPQLSSGFCRKTAGKIERGAQEPAALPILLSLHSKPRGQPLLPCPNSSEPCTIPPAPGPVGQHQLNVGPMNVTSLSLSSRGRGSVLAAAAPTAVGSCPRPEPQKGLSCLTTPCNFWCSRLMQHCALP